MEKDRDKSLLNSYRPILLPPTLGKVLEKLLLNKLNFHLRSHNLMHTFQFGFWKGKLIEHALIRLQDKIQEAKQNNKYSVILSLDIKCAFDHLQYHEIRERFKKRNLNTSTAVTLGYTE
ncbi:hypothetical protein AVEN_77961-1 [Araneus ventricosus]|uniref:Reverse transcriptase domain-containing protein n=1 Tax=Araneus ventricosus TaxID=182803 RepID=A0A4Y2V392_ARAVE|nr:hypothetical protein AVEN_77961-1 [Araneus ventricosus]